MVSVVCSSSVAIDTDNFYAISTPSTVSSQVYHIRNKVSVEFVVSLILSLFYSDLSREYDPGKVWVMLVCLEVSYEYILKTLSDYLCVSHAWNGIQE
jgi:hypothetical protein